MQKGRVAQGCLRLNPKVRFNNPQTTGGGHSTSHPPCEDGLDPSPTLDCEPNEPKNNTADLEALMATSIRSCIIVQWPGSTGDAQASSIHTAVPPRQYLEASVVRERNIIDHPLRQWLVVPPSASLPGTGYSLFLTPPLSYIRLPPRLWKI